jgi:predicted Zn-dependent peptidase
MYERTVLSNGLRLLVSPMPHAYSVSIGSFIGTGSRYEDDVHAGVSHFIEHMLFKGTEKWPTARALSEAIEGVGGVSNAGTGRDSTAYWMKVVRHHMPVAIDVLVDMLRKSTFVPEEIERERQVIAEEIKMYLDNPEDLAQQAITTLQWPDNPAGRDIAGTLASVANLTRDQIIQFMNEHYGPTNTVFAIAGNVTLPEIVDYLEADLGDWQGGARQSYIPIQSDQVAPRVHTIFRQTEQGNLYMTVPSLPRNDPERFILGLLNAVLGEGTSSRLFQEIREKHGLAYNVESYIETLNETGVIGAYAGVDPERIDQAIRAILDEWDRSKQELIPPAELDRAREYVKGRMLLRMEDTSVVADWYGHQELLQTNEVMDVEEVIARMDEITAEDVRAMAQRLFVPEKTNLAVVGPFGAPNAPDTERFRKLLTA